MANNHRVIIVGGGFGGLRAAQAFKGAPVDVTLIDKRNFNLFQPLLYQVATGSLSPGEIAVPLRSALRRQENTRVLLGDVVDIDPASKTVRLADGAQLEYDSLIVAAGSQTSYFGHDDWREWAPSLKSVEEATGVRHKIFYAFEVAERISDPARRRAWLTFVIVGAGPTGVEMAGAIAQLARETLRRDFRSIHPEEAQIILMDGAPRVLPPFPEKLSRKATESLARLGVEVRTGVMVKDIDKEGLTYQGPDGLVRLDARTVIWGGGVAVTPLARTLAKATQAETDKGGRIKVGRTPPSRAIRTSTSPATWRLDRPQERQAARRPGPGRDAGGRPCREGHRAQAARKAAAAALQVLRQGDHVRHRPVEGRRERVWRPRVGISRLVHLGVHPPRVSHAVRDARPRVLAVVDPGPDLRTRIAPDHGRHSQRLLPG